MPKVSMYGVTTSIHALFVSVLCTRGYLGSDIFFPMKRQSRLLLLFIQMAGGFGVIV